MYKRHKNNCLHLEAWYHVAGYIDDSTDHSAMLALHITIFFILIAFLALQ